MDSSIWTAAARGVSPWKVFLPPVLATTAAFLVALTILDVSHASPFSSSEAWLFFLGSIPYRVAWALGFSLLPGGMVLARTGYHASTVAWVAVVSAGVVFGLEAGVYPYLEYLLDARFLGPNLSDSFPFGPQDIDSLLREAAVLRVRLSAAGVQGIPPDPEVTMMMFGETVPFLRVVLCFVNVACGYLAAGRLKLLPTARTAWLLLLLVDGAFFFGIRFAFMATVMGAAQSQMAIVLPLVLPLAALSVLLLLGESDRGLAGLSPATRTGLR